MHEIWFALLSGSYIYTFLTTKALPRKDDINNLGLRVKMLSAQVTRMEGRIDQIYEHLMGKDKK